MRLSQLKPGDTVVVTKILGHGAFRKRVMEMGFVRGREITMVLNAPLADPIKFKLMDYEVSLRRSEADLIEVEDLSTWEKHARQIKRIHTEEHDIPSATSDDEIFRKDKIINVALIGNPNCGKTSLFNIASGAHEHVGNYAGVTVGAKAGSLKYKGYKINIVDLPGTYSLSAYSPEELYVMRYLNQEMPDVIVNVVVASNLERNLYLTTELIDMNRSMVIDLNMYDELEHSNAKLDHEHLGRLLGVPIVPTKASTGWGVDRLLDTIIDVYEMRQKDVRHIHVKMRRGIEEGVNAIKDLIKHDPTITQKFAPRYLAIKMLEGDPEADAILRQAASYKEIKERREEQASRIEQELQEDVQSAVAADKYGFIQGALAETMEGDMLKDEKTTRIIDAVVTSKVFGFPIFLCSMFLMFWATFELGAYPMEWIESLVGWISGLLSEHVSDGPLKDLVIDGIIGGVGGVIVFLPNILILYLFISLMEDTGYMARVAFIMDKLMHKMGLHGKSFIPLVMGFGCNVPAIMSTRIIESKSSRLITILINPFISCSARIPIYVLLIGCFFPHCGGLVFFLLYFTGIAVAVIMAKLFRKFWFKADETPFVMELPPYRMPTGKAIMRGMWSKARQYLNKMGGIILVASIIIWALSYFPRQKMSDVPESYRSETIADMPAEMKAEMSQEKIDDLVLNAYQQENSILGNIGKAVEPAVRPMDFGWKTTVSLLAGAAAKEVVVSTMGVLYVGEDDADLISERIKTPSPLTGKAPFDAPKALAFMAFVLLYFPCVATLAAIARETGNWRYALFSALYNTALAWILSFIVYRIAILF